MGLGVRLSMLVKLSKVNICYLAFNKPIKSLTLAYENTQQSYNLSSSHFRMKLLVQELRTILDSVVSIFSH